MFLGIGAAAVRLEVRPYMTIRDIEVEGPERDEPLNYPGYWADHSFPVLRANGSELEDRNYCWNGFREYLIPPGRSARVHITHDEFVSRPSKNASVEVGFNLRPASISEYSIHFSQPFQIPEAFRKTINVK
ncbi:MAG: hypothetical protein AAB288_04625 [Acidobacteriota bacterium]